MTKAKTPSLDDTRKRLDAIDDRILALVDERTALAAEVAAAKQAQGEGDSLALKPARESQILRRLLGRREEASASLVVRVWREIIGENLYRQSPFHIAAWGGSKGAGRVAELARQRFGSACAMVMMDEPEQAIATAKHTSGVAVLALAPHSWWWGRLLVEPTLSVFAILPELNAWGQPGALAVAAVTVEPSGPGDETLWVTDSALASYEIEIKLSQEGVVGRLLAEAGGLKLFALAGFFQRDDARLARAPGRMTGVIGAAPAPFDG
jgi:chorismate mutase